MEGITILSITDLVKKADIRWKEDEQKRADHKAKLKGILNTAIGEESGLIKKLTQEKKVVAGMEKEYFEMEKKVEKETTAAVEKNELTAEKVKSGEISIREFQARGVTAGEKVSLIIAGILEKLKASLKVIRSKRKEVLQKELELAKLKNKVNSLRLYPAQILSKSYQDQIEFLNTNMGVLHAAVVTSNSSVKLLEHFLHLTDGRGLSAGHSWTRLTLEQAMKIPFDPILPESLIQDFKQQLHTFQDPEELINVRLHTPPGRDSSIEVDPAAGIGPIKQVILTGKKVKKNKKYKAITTREI